MFQTLLDSIVRYGERCADTLRDNDALVAWTRKPCNASPRPFAPCPKTCARACRLCEEEACAQCPNTPDCALCPPHPLCRAAHKKFDIKESV